MGWNAILAADLELPAGALGAWKALAFDDRTYDDWGPLTSRTPSSGASTVGGTLAQLDAFGEACARGGVDMFRLTQGEGTIQLRALLNEDDYRSIGREVATILRLAARVGARGQFLVLADDGCDGERTVLDGDEGSAESITLAEVYEGAAAGPTDVDYAAVVDEIFAFVANPISAPTKKAPAKKAPAKKPPAKRATPKKPLAR
jgi:hypothetical protein